MELISNFKKNNPILFWVLIPLLIIPIILGVVSSFFLSNTTEDIREANKEDSKLKEEADKANAAADVHKNNAYKLEKEIKELEDDENWDI